MFSDVVNTGVSPVAKIALKVIARAVESLGVSGGAGLCAELPSALKALEICKQKLTSYSSRISIYKRIKFNYEVGKIE